MAFNLDNYETVEDRLKRFWSDNPNGRIETHVAKINDEGTMVIVKALIYKDFDDEKAVSTGYAQEYKGQGGFANKEAWLENCETSAIGRGLANWKYQGSDKARPSKEEMRKSSGSNTQGETIKSTPKGTPKEGVVAASSATPSPAKQLKDAGYGDVKAKHDNGLPAMGKDGLLCPCNVQCAVNYIKEEDKKSAKSPDFRCSMMGQCVGGDTVDGKVFAKSWWMDNKATPAAWRDYAAVQNGMTLPKAKSLDDIKEGEAPF